MMNLTLKVNRITPQICVFFLLFKYVGSVLSLLQDKLCHLKKRGALCVSVVTLCYNSNTPLQLVKQVQCGFFYRLSN